MDENGEEKGVIRKSVAGEDKVNIPLNGSATVKIKDNSKTFQDVSAVAGEAETDSVAGAVAFVSAHELFQGTGNETFSPDQPMSRGMLATVLHRLEGQPAAAESNSFSDVSSGAWYAGGVAWAAEKGIASGEDGKFAPDAPLTREQFVLMLWKYAGSPKAKSQELDPAFPDAETVSSDDAKRALCWAVEKGIVHGSGGKLAPAGITTRAQAALMLKRFMENA